MKSFPKFFFTLVLFGLSSFGSLAVGGPTSETANDGIDGAVLWHGRFLVMTIRQTTDMEYLPMEE